MFLLSKPIEQDLVEMDPQTGAHTIERILDT